MKEIFLFLLLRLRWERGIIERYITFDQSMEGADRKASLLPHEFTQMVQGIKQVHMAMGSTNPRIITQAELINRNNLSKSIAAKGNLKKGTIINREHLTFRSPGTGLPTKKLEEFLGTCLHREVADGELFLYSDLNDKLNLPLEISLPYKFGIPVRYHDFEGLSKLSNFNFFEFHLTYKDLDLNIKDFIKDNKTKYISVHAPELFEGDHLLNLASLDNNYLIKSVDFFKRTVEALIKIKDVFAIKNRVP